jgi:hypothetical protein
MGTMRVNSARHRGVLGDRYGAIHGACPDAEFLGGLFFAFADVFTVGANGRRLSEIERSDQHTFTGCRPK